MQQPNTPPKTRLGEERQNASDDGHDGGGPAAEENAGECTGAVGNELQHRNDLPFIGCGKEEETSRAITEIGVEGGIRGWGEREGGGTC